MGINVQLSRRGFIGGASAFAAASLLFACGKSQDTSTATDASEQGAETVASTPEIKVTGGRICGYANADGDITIFKGIPYAAPPVADLRWKAPQPVEEWEGVRKCTEYAQPPCRASRHPS